MLKTLRVCFAFTLLTVLDLGAAFAAGAPATPPAPPFPVAKVITEIKRELQVVQSTPSPNVGLTLSKVTLDFTLTRTVDANGKVTIGIPAIEAEVGATGQVKSEDTSSMTIELVPPKAEAAMSAVQAENLGIAEAVIDARKQLAAGLAEEPKLMPNKVDLTFKYVLTAEGGPTGKIKFLIVSVEAGATVSSAHTQSITLSFSKTLAP